MHQPKTIAASAWKEIGLELGILYIVTSIATAHLLGMHWLVAMAVAPFMVLVIIAGLVLFVQILWMLVLGLEKIGTSMGFRKSPLA